MKVECRGIRTCGHVPGGQAAVGAVPAVAGYSAGMNSRPAPFDELDRKIITALMANARTSFAEIGAAIGLSATAVKRRVDRLRETGVITGFTATVEPSALGWRTEAYVEVYCEGAAPPRRLAEVVRNHPEITAAMTVTGGADALLHVRATGRGALREGAGAHPDRAVHPEDDQLHGAVPSPPGKPGGGGYPPCPEQHIERRSRPALMPSKTQHSCADTQSLSLVERRAQFLPWCTSRWSIPQEAEESLCARQPCAAPPALSRL